MILEVDGRFVRRLGGERHNARKVTLPSKKVQLDASEERQKGEGVNEGECSSDGLIWSASA